MGHLPDRLIEGYRSFKEGRLAGARERYRTLAEQGQSPEILVISCCDSRAAPETIFDSGPGEIFVVRNVANLVQPYEPDGASQATSAALEFAVQGLKVGHIVVLGHSLCGGIKAALNPASEPLSPGDFIGKWMAVLSPTAEAVRTGGGPSEAERQTELERASIRFSLANLRTFPFVSSLETEGRLKLHGAWFDIADGCLWVMSPDNGEFTKAD